LLKVRVHKPINFISVTKHFLEKESSRSVNFCYKLITISTMIEAQGFTFKYPTSEHRLCAL